MKTRALFLCLGIFGLAVAGCADLPPEEPRPPSAPATKPEARPVAEGKRIPYPNPDSKTVFLEILPDKTKRVLVEAEVCLREGPIELLLCRSMTKEHEAILRADLDARHLHAALNFAGLKEGAPVQFQPNYKPARGDRVRVLLRYQKDGKTVEVPAREWVRNSETKKDLATDWVFAGSKLLRDPEDDKKPPFYAANSGDVICVSNFDTALLDVPIASSKADDARAYEANSSRIPPKETKVTVVLEKAPEPQ